MADVPAKVLRLASTAIVEMKLDLSVAGLENVPPAGPAIIAARHYHHLYDGCAILATIPRRVRVLVGLDWADGRFQQSLMHRACDVAQWPIIHRAQAHRPANLHLLRAAIKACTTLLRQGQVILVFPEGYPTIDPHGSPKTSASEFLPFQPGFAHIARLAAAEIGSIPVVPAGFWYGAPATRQRVVLRFGNPEMVEPTTSVSPLVQRVQREVELLSA